MSQHKSDPITNAEGLVYVFLGPPFNKGAYVRPGTDIPVDVSSDRNATRSRKYAMKPGIRGLCLAGREKS